MNARKTMRRIKTDVASLAPGRNWITTLGGLLLAGGATAPFLPPPYNAYAAAAGAAGGAILGFGARQANVSSDEMRKTKLPPVQEIKQP